MTLIITNTIERDKISVDFNFQDGALPFPSVEINTEGDIDFNSLIVKLTEAIEHNGELEISYVDENLLVDSNSKIGLIKTTLDEIYNGFNSSLKKEINEDFHNADDSDLPF